MVNDPKIPLITWEENFNLDDARRVSDLIVATLTEKLASKETGHSRLFFFIPTPTPYQKAEAKLFNAFRVKDDSGCDLRVLALPQNGRCYVTSSAQCFKELIPHAFQLGPAELTFVATNCKSTLSEQEDNLVNFVLTVLEGTKSTTQEFAGMHFDSGDLVEVF